jgi:ketosteroid isomerase-like protein
MLSMPQEDLVARLRAANDAWNRGDIDVMLSLLDPEFDWHTAGEFPGLDPVYRGPNGWRKFDRDFREAWDSLQVLIDEVHQVDDKVVALATFHTRGREGIELRRPIAWVTTFSDGLAVRGDVYAEWKQALEAARSG